MNLEPRHVQTIDHDLGDVTFYWGVASGGTHAALSRAHEDDDQTPGHLMLSWATAMNGVWEGPEWMIDSGGAPQTIKKNGGHAGTIGDYLDYLRDPPTKYGSDPDDVNIGRVALRDWPTEPGVRDTLDMTVEELQQKTIEDHAAMIDIVRDDPQIDAEPVAVLQGWEPDDYLDHLDMMRDHGLITDAIGLGSVCRRFAIDEIQDIAHRVRRNLPPRVDLHGFGVKQDVLEQPGALTVFDTVDSAAWENTIRYATKDGHERGPPQDGLGYDDWIDWDDRGNPRYTWKNIQLSYEGYADQVADIQTQEVDRDVIIRDLSDWPQVMDDLSARGDDEDGYALLQCICGTVVDPGHPEPVPDPGCRHCERAGIDIWDYHLQQREGPYD